MAMAANAGINPALGGQAGIECQHSAVWVVEVSTRRIVRKPCEACEEATSLARRASSSDRLAS